MKRPAERGSCSSSPPTKVKKVHHNHIVSENQGASPIPQRKLRRVASATQSMQSSVDHSNDSNSKTMLDNPTPAMLLVMKRKLEKQLQQNELIKSENSIDKNGLKRPLSTLKPVPEILSLTKKKGNVMSFYLLNHRCQNFKL